MSVKSLNHIGIAVHSIDEQRRRRSVLDVDLQQRQLGLAPILHLLRVTKLLTELLAQL